MVRRALFLLLGLMAVVASGYAGVRLARSPARLGSAGPLELRAVVGADATIVKPGVAGKVRLVAVREGDAVGKGRLVAWLDAPELRDAAKAAEDAVREAQRGLESLQRGRRSRPREELAHAETEAAAAQRALEDAEELSREAPLLAQRLEAARTAQQEAAAALTAAEAALAQAEAAGTAPAVGTPPSAGEGALESSPPAGEGTESPEPGTRAPADPAVAQAQAALEKARSRKAAADAEVEEARRLNRRAEAAAKRLSSLSEQALRAAATLQEVRSRVSSAPPEEETGTTDADRMRGEVRDAQVAAAQARSRLRAAVVVAPVDGLVETVAATAGQEMSDDDPIATIRRLDTVWAEVTIPASAADRVRRNQKVAVEALSAGDVKLEGTVTEMAPESTDTDSSWVIRVSFPNSGNRFLPGSDVQLTFR